MSKKSQHKKPGRPPNPDTQRLVVWGERRQEPDWDSYVAALLAFALREVEGDETEEGTKS
jgi:hypothetical protein